MPAFISHYLFGLDIYNRMENLSVKKTIHDNRYSYNLGLQGPDLFFYNLPMVFGPNEQNVGGLMHEQNVNVFFYHYMNQLFSLSTKEFPIGFSYLCGLLCHYCLDVHLHPYIYFRSGFRTDEKDSSKKTFPAHAQMESQLDTILLKMKKNIPPSKFKQSATLAISSREVDLISELMSRSVTKAFPINNVDLLSKEAFKKTVFYTKLGTVFLHDSTGLKRKVLRKIEQGLHVDHVLSSLIVTDALTDSLDICNNNHSSWANPWDLKITSTASVEELYNDSLNHYKSFLPYLYSFNKDSIHFLLSLIGNKSYHSGLDSIGTTSHR